MSGNPHVVRRIQKRGIDTIVAKLNAGINEVLRQPDTAEHLRGMNMTPIGGAADGIKAFIKDETERWGPPERGSFRWGASISRRREGSPSPTPIPLLLRAARQGAR